MKLAFFFLSLIFPLVTLAAEDIWTAFWDEENYKLGFMDNNGEIKIAPKFMGMTQAREFKHIVAVMEEKDGGYEAYYLLKNGKKIENVNMFVFDNSFDCESDKKIRFRDKETDAMGYLDEEGNIAIPPIYNTGQPFVNGFASVIKGASLFCHDGKPYTSTNRCEHPEWKGGKQLIINENNEIVINGSYLGYDLDRYSASISDKPSDIEHVESFRAVEGKYYNFINTTKHFEKWFTENILSDLSKSNLENHTFEEITLFKSGQGWYKKPQLKFWRNNYKTVKKSLSLINQDKTSFFVNLDSLNQGIYKEDKYLSYYSECYNQYANQHPTLSAVVSHENEDSLVQNSYVFLKIKDSYKLISLTLRTAKLH